MPEPIICPLCLKTNYHALPLKGMPDTFYVCYACGHVWKVVRKDDPSPPPKDA